MVRPSLYSDNHSLLQLTAQNAMKGAIALRIDRKPDFFALLKSRGESHTLVDEQNGEIVGSFSSSCFQAYVNQELTTIHYLCDLKVDNKIRGGRTAFALVKQMTEYLADQGDLVYLLVADGNTAMDPFLEGRLGIPPFKSLGQFKVLQFLPKKKEQTGQYVVEQLNLSVGLEERFNEFHKQYQMGKHIEQLNHQNLWVARHGGKIVAAISLADPSELKQNVVINVNPLLRVLITASRWLPMPTLPGINEAIRILYVDHFFYQPGHKEAIKALIGQAQVEAGNGQYHFLSLGVHERDPLYALFKGKFKFTFNSNAYLASTAGNQHLVDEIADGLPYEDYSLV